MDGLALYLWYLLRSRYESEIDGEEVKLPHVKLPEITVLRRNDQNVRRETSRKRKRVSFAEPLNKNGTATKNTTDLMEHYSQSNHYTLVPVYNDHDYTSAPLVCYRRLADDTEVKKSVEVKGIDDRNQLFENEELETLSPRFVKRDLIINKTYKPVYCWNDLLEQFDAKPEDGKKLFDELINALGDDVEGICGDVDDDDELESDQDEDHVPIETSNNDNDDDFDTSSVEGVWDCSDTEGDSIMKTKRSDSLKNAYQELFDRFEDEDLSQREVSYGNLKSLDDSSGELQNLPEESCVDDEPPLTTVVSFSEKQEDPSCEHPNITKEEEDSSAEESRIVIASTQSVVFEIICDTSEESQVQAKNGIQRSGRSAIESFLEDDGIVQPDPATKLLSSSDEESETEFQYSEETNPSFTELCDWSDPPMSVSYTPGSARENRSKTCSENEKPKWESRRRSGSDDQPKIKKQRRQPKNKIIPIDQLSKRQSIRQSISRLAKEIRLSHDPLELMDNDRFRSTFGVSKEFASFLINSLTPHLPLPEKSRSHRTPANLKVLTTLCFFATGLKNCEIGKVTHMSQPQVSRCIAEVINSLIITAPDSELPSLDSEFNEFYGLPELVGAVDATQIPIKPPCGAGKRCPGRERFKNDNPMLYKNSAAYHSINFEVVSSSSNRVLFCCTNFPGSYTKSQMWHESKVRELMVARHNEGIFSGKLIAGSGYDCEPWLLTPCSVTDPDSPEANYNAALGNALIDSVRLTIGLLKGRFKCLSTASSQQALFYSPAKACQVFTACCILHNLAMDFGEEIPVPNLDPMDMLETKNASNEINWDGFEVRNNYIIDNFC